jgi:hypothetical protein
MVGMVRLFVEMGQELHRKLYFCATGLKGMEQVCWPGGVTAVQDSLVSKSP